MEARLGRMMSLAKPTCVEQRQMDDGFIHTQRGTVAPAETQAVVATESRGGVDGLLCLGGLREEAHRSLGIKGLAGGTFFAHQEIHGVALDQAAVQL